MPPQDNNLAVSARDLSFSFGEGELRKQILFDIDLDINRGEIVLLTGPSGSGKTTLLTLIAALRRVMEGELNVLGHALHECSDTERIAIRRKIGFIFQSHNLMDYLTAQQNVELALQVHPELTPEEKVMRATQLLQAVGLGDRLHYKPAKLSGGQKQRVAIARALAGHPQLVLADEPTAALDSHSGRDVVNLLQRLAREEGCTILMVTHDQRVLDVADRVIHMEDGRIESGAVPLPAV